MKSSRRGVTSIPNSKRFLSQGFTLIELLVVIAVIGVLASVVMSSLSDARAKGSDASIKQSIGNMRAQAELYYDDNANSYSGMCDDPSVTNALTAADTANAGGSVICVDGDDVTGAWAMAAQLVASTTQYYCIDSDGKGVVIGSSTISNAVGSEDAVCG